MRKMRQQNSATIIAKREAGVTEQRKSFWRRHGWVKWVAGGLLLVLAVAAVVVDLGLRQAEPYLRARIVAALENRFHARVELDSFHVSLVNGLWAEGKGLRIWPPAHVEGVGVPAGQGEPLIRLDDFRFHAPLRYRPGEAIHVSVVELKGLIIQLPPRSHFEHPAENSAGGSKAAGKPAGAASLVSFDVDRIECTGAELIMGTDKPGKLPLEFAIARLSLNHIASGGAMGFDAELTNPKPLGTIKTTGNFGPWQKTDPGESPLAGDYRFEHADLGTFKGIAGILDSTGHFQGTLRDLTVDGETRTPDFRLTHYGNTLALTTRFHARVDGTNGDTWLEPVEATLGHSHFTAQGAIVRMPGAVVGGAQQYGGHDIALTVNVDRARIEDFLHLASRTDKILLTGDVTMKTKLHIPPGAAPIHERLNLDGRFALDKARFTSAKIQGRIAQLSLRGQGRPGDVKTADPASILSHMDSSFQLSGGVITLPALDYTVPGAKIKLKGTYGLEGGALNFDGTAKMEASVSKMVGGWKGFLLKPVDRHFKKEGAGTEVQIHIDGTREEPKFGIDFYRKKAVSTPAMGDLP
jgi:AsmA-like C-terminal region